MSGFPAGEYTPFGYLRNPGHRATSWQSTTGGNLRSATDGVGVEWVYPLQRRPAARAGLGLKLTLGKRTCSTRADFEALGLTSRYHSALVLGFDVELDGLDLAARFFLHTDDMLCARLTLASTSTEPASLRVGMLGRVEGDLEPHTCWEAPEQDYTLAPGQSRVIFAALGRGPAAAARPGDAVLEATFQRLLGEDAAFYATCPVLAGDWPSGWREGLIYDFETTRLLVQPADGVFPDVWPAWMAAWPRVVLAEGALDMLRLSYADPPLAMRAVLSMFAGGAATGQPNVPCIFYDGTPNMVAADGSVCGTSPAWCLPFLNLELIYLRTLDRPWLERLYPFLSAYLDWWLSQRADPEGWLVYRCTWEAGEDGNPRLDPTESGDRDISHRVRPVELQAAMAHAAKTMAFFASQLGREADIQPWQRIEAEYRRRTRALFDGQRYRDQVLEPPAVDKGPRAYWGVDTSRYSALSLLPALIDEPLDEAELWRHASPPWTLWPSWTLALVESAAAQGRFDQVGELVARQIERVYRVTTRRMLGSLERPMPGTAPEYWPMDWHAFDASEAYGWGATTANLLLRHLFGFKESRHTQAWVAHLTPAFPSTMLIPGVRYTVRRLNYRGLSFDLGYTVLDRRRLLARLDLGGSERACSVVSEPDGADLYASPRPLSAHRFELTNGAAAALTIS